MPFDWKTYLELAEFLRTQAEAAPTQEAFLRSAVSRAYYAAFCYVRNHARDRLRFQPRDDGDDHGRLRAFLKNGKLRGVSNTLQRLREWRNECDYLDELTIQARSTLDLALTETRSIFARLAPPTSSFES